MKAVLIAGTQSGAGKTTTTLGLLAAAKRRGLRVRAFKVGPDFIDPGHHLAVTGRTSHNLDGWMLDKTSVRRLFERNCRDADGTAVDLAVVEGVMGLYDGSSGSHEAGSSAEIAKWLDIPVLLVLNARSMARSAAAVVKGFTLFDPSLRFAGVLCNNTGSPRHVGLLQEAMASVPEAPLLGCLPRTADLRTPSRHLGLITADELNWQNGRLDTLADWFENALPTDALLAALPELPLPVAADDSKCSFQTLPLTDVRIAVAKDAAFCFYYEENLRLLRAAGAETVFFSPMHDACLPPGTTGVYLGGGYPELYASQLAANAPMREQIRKFSSDGGPMYAECGGLMYLCQSLEDKQGERFPMCGIFAMHCGIRDTGMTLGYRAVRLIADTPLGHAGALLRGHEFHYSHLAGEDPEARLVYEATKADGTPSGTLGLLKQATLASYVHVHFGSTPATAGAFVKHCRDFEQKGCKI